MIRFPRCYRWIAPQRLSFLSRFAAAIGLLACLASGCRTGGLFAKDDRADIGGVRGPNERRLGLFRKNEEKPDYSPTLKPIAGQEDFDAAEAIYNAGRFSDAQKAFKKVARKYKKSEIREDALFMAAESAFKQEKLSQANDDYARLLKDFPSTRHLDAVSRRLFAIATEWLSVPEHVDLSEIQQANYDEPRRRLPAEAARDVKRPSPIAPNFTNKKRPWFDPEGNAIAALRAIWLNDPTGPLADDALMLAASHYARTGKFVEADRYFSLLREEYPSSQHVEAAFLVGSHVKLMSYEGPDYEGRQLKDAAQLKESTLRLFPTNGEKERLEEELLRIHDAEAQRLWEMVVFYRKKSLPRSQAVYCHLVLESFPDTRFAEMARDELGKLGPQYANGAVFLDARPEIRPKAWYDPLVGNRQQLPRSLTGEPADAGGPAIIKSWRESKLFLQPKPLPKPGDDEYVSDDSLDPRPAGDREEMDADDEGEGE